VEEYVQVVAVVKPEQVVVATFMQPVPAALSVHYYVAPDLAEQEVVPLV
jgi:hypothetical protein